MLHKKKLRNKHRLPVIEVNVVSLMDILTTLLFFLVFAANFQNFSILEGKATPAGTSTSDQKPSFALDITLLKDNQARIYLAPISKLEVQQRSTLLKMIQSRFKGNESLGYLTLVNGRTPTELKQKIQSILVVIKKSFPNEMKAMLTVADPIGYQSMIHLLASIRELDNDRKPFQVRSPQGTLELSRVLFPMVLIQEYGGSA